MQKYFEMREEQEIERQKYLNEMRQMAYRKSGFPKEIDGAFLAAEVIYEREKQIELNKVLKQRDREVEAEFAEKVRKGVIDEKQEKEEKERKRREKNKEFAELYLKEYVCFLFNAVIHLFICIRIRERKEREEKMRREKIKAEITDYVNATIEMEDIEKCRRQEVCLQNIPNQIANFTFNSFVFFYIYTFTNYWKPLLDPRKQRNGEKTITKTSRYC